MAAGRIRRGRESNGYGGHGGPRGILDDQSLEDINAVLDTNLKGTILCTRAALALLRAGNDATVVNVASELATSARPT